MGGGPRPPGTEPAPTDGSLIAIDPPEHGRHRAIVNRGFTPRRIAELEPRIRKLADELWAASRQEGKAMTTRDQTHRMAEANKAFAHFAK